MGQISDIKGEILEALRSDPRFYNIQLVEEYSGVARELPVRNTTIAVGVESIDAKPAGLGGYLGEVESLSRTGLMATLTLRFDCYFPRSGDIAGLHAIFEALCECLLDHFPVTRIWCDPAKADNQALATHLCARASMTVCLEKGEKPGGVHDIIIQRRSEAIA